MSILAESTSTSRTAEFYRQTLQALTASGVPFLVGGTFALSHYTGITRETKDLDLFILPSDWFAAEAALNAAGIETELTFPHWLGKAWSADGRDLFCDVIFSGGNGVARVDERWFRHAEECELFDVPVRVCPCEEMIWSKAFVMERERFDGADVNHLIQARRETIDWDHLFARFGPYWRVLLAHLVLYTFAYPGEPLPAGRLEQLTARLTQEPSVGHSRLCRGTLLSRSQYLVDVEDRRYLDARIVPFGTMTRATITDWTAAAER